MSLDERYLKNAWAKKDADGDYWLFIRNGEGPGNVLSCRSAWISTPKKTHSYAALSMRGWQSKTAQMARLNERSKLPVRPVRQTKAA